MQPASDWIVTPREGTAGGRGRSWAEDQARIAAFSLDSAHSWHFTSTDNTSCPPPLSQVCPGCFTPTGPSSGVLEMWPNTSPVLMSARGPQEPRVQRRLSFITSKGQLGGLDGAEHPQSLPRCQPGATELSVCPVPRTPKVPVPTNCTPGRGEPSYHGPHRSDPARYSSRGIPQEQEVLNLFSWLCPGCCREIPFLPGISWVVSQMPLPEQGGVC